MEGKAYDFTAIDLTVVHNEPTNNDVSKSAVVESTVQPEQVAEKAEITIGAPEQSSEKKDQNNVENDLPMTSKEMAKFTVGLINVGLSAGMPALYLKSEFTDVERSVIEKLQSGIDVENNQFTQDVQRKFMQYVKKCESIPLTKDEVASYEKAWEKCFNKWDMKMTPETALVVSTTMIVGSRFVPVLGSGLSKLFGNG